MKSFLLIYETITDFMNLYPELFIFNLDNIISQISLHEIPCSSSKIITEANMVFS